MPVQPSRISLLWSCLSGRGCAYRARLSELGATTVVGDTPWKPGPEQLSPNTWGWLSLGYEPVCSKGRRGLNWELSWGDHSARARRDIFRAPHGQPGATAFLCTEPWAGLHCLSACPIIQPIAFILSALQGSSSLSQPSSLCHGSLENWMCVEKNRINIWE